MTTAVKPDVGAPGNPEAHKVAAYPLFDWLRFVLASIVVLDHTGFRVFPFLSGGLAVDIFFALSGWLIGGILLSTSRAELPRFFFNRSTRIWIPYAVAIILLYSVAALKEGIDFFWFKYLFLDVTFTHQLYTFFPVATFELPLDGSGNQFWSIAVEEQFYLIAPLIMLILPSGKSIWIWVPIALLTMFMGWHAAPVSLGVCAAILQRDFDIARSVIVRSVAMIVFLSAATWMWISATESLAAPIFAIATVILTAIPGRRSALALVAGGLSYPLYLNQWIAAFVVNFFEKRWLPLDQVAYVTIVYLFSIVMGFILYWLIDRRIQHRRNDWYSPSLGKALGVAAYVLVAFGIVGGGLMHLYGPHAVVPPGYETSNH